MMFLALQLLFALANAQCGLYESLFNNWNLLTSADASILDGDLKGRSYVTGTAFLTNFEVGRALEHQCSTFPAISANKIVATEGNFCGASAEANTFENMVNTGSNIGCEWQLAWTSCNQFRVSPLRTVSFFPVHIRPDPCRVVNGVVWRRWLTI